MKRITLAILILILSSICLGGNLPIRPSDDDSTTTRLPIDFENLQGGDSSGGGTSIVLKSGEVIFTDLADPKFFLNSKILSKYEREMYFRSSYYLPLTNCPREPFFKETLETFSYYKNEFPVLEKLIYSLQFVSPIFITLRPSPQTEYFSPSFPVNLQEPIAIYINHKLLISITPYGRMSPISKKALAIHEGLRHLNFLELLDKKLSTKEIEIAVRYFLDLSFKSDEIEPILEKFKSTKKDTNDYIFKGVSRISRKINFIENRINKITGIKNDFSDPEKIVSVINDITELQLSTLLIKELLRLNILRISLQKQHQKFLHAVMIGVDSAKSIQKLTAHAWALNDLLYLQELPECLKIDIYTNKITNLCFKKE